MIHSLSDISILGKSKRIKTSASFDEDISSSDCADSSDIDEIYVDVSSDESELITVDISQQVESGKMESTDENQSKLSCCHQSLSFETAILNYQFQQFDEDEKDCWYNGIRKQSNTALDEQERSAKSRRAQSPQAIMFDSRYRRILVHKSKGDQWCMGVKTDCRGKDEFGVPYLGTWIVSIDIGSCYAEQLRSSVNIGDELIEWNEHKIRGMNPDMVQKVIGETNGEAELLIKSLNSSLSVESSEQTSPRAISENSIAHSEPVRQHSKEEFNQCDLVKVETSSDTVQNPQITLITSPIEDNVSDCVSRSSLIPTNFQLMRSRSTSRLTTMKDDEIKRIKTLRHSRTHGVDKMNLSRGAIQAVLTHCIKEQELHVKIVQAKGLLPRDSNGLSDPYVKLYLLPGREKDNKRKTRYVPRTLNPAWNEMFVFCNIHQDELQYKTLEISVWDYDRITKNDFIGITHIQLSDSKLIDGVSRWYKLHPASSSSNQ
ncbi:hypothetical protein ACOME3_001892 [Neoechinorhynchus agilis]